MKTNTLVLALMLALASAPALAQQKRFATPEEAVDAMVKAAEKSDFHALEQLFGPEYAEFHRGQDADLALAENRRERFKEALKEFRSLSVAGTDKRVLHVGSEGWPFPIPIVKKGNRWQFDGAAGVEELRNRIVGANELNAIATLDAYSVGQRLYGLDDHDGDGVLEYAQRLESTAGTHDGLYWESDVEDPDAVHSPLGPLVALAELALGEREPGDPFLGYNFRILTSQGAGAKAGAYDYLVNGHMVGGYAAVAWPADYGETGVKTFLVNQDGMVYEKDLGDDTPTAVAAIKRFDIGEGWAVVDDENLLGETAAATASKD